ncbi:MAG: type II secretion system protein GspC [Desulfuromonadales bacterium]|nr:type II secretion system protein GspC [Desulfuromonadales bacterium]
MLNVLHSFYKPFCLSLLVLLGLACGHLINTLLQMNLRPEFTVENIRVQPDTAKSAKTSQADLNLILQNNIFDANNRSAGATMTFESGLASGEEVSAAAARADLKLFGTVVAAERSQALLEVNKELKLYSLDEEIPGGGSIEEIQRNQVTIRNRDQSLTTLMLYDQEALPSRVTPSRVETSRGTVGEVKEVGDNRWLISRNTIESVRENFADQLRLAQMQPRTLDGKTDGFLIRRINPRSLLVKLGLQRGDVIIDVNNIRLDSPEKALQVFQQLREARQISVAVERNGQPMSFSYEIE